MAKPTEQSSARPADPGNPEHHPRTVTGADVVAKARELLGAPYLHQGRGPKGIDCVGVPIWTLAQLGILPRGALPANYQRIPTGELIRKLEHYCTRLVEPELGCLVVIRWPGEPQPGHVAIRTDLGILHAYKNHGGVREHGYRAKWPEWTDSLWRMPGVSNG